MGNRGSRKQVFAVVGFTNARGGLAVGSPAPADSEASALRLAERMAGSKAGAVAFYRTGDPEAGEFDAPVVIAQFGVVPDGLAEILSA